MIQVKYIFTKYYQNGKEMNPDIINIITDVYFMREVELSTTPVQVTESESFMKMKRNEKKYSTFDNNLHKFNFPIITRTFTDYIISMIYIRNGAPRSGITLTDSKILKEHARFIAGLHHFKSATDAYFANLYSIPINFDSITKINNTIRILLKNCSTENYDIGKSLGRDKHNTIVYDWLHKKHIETYEEIMKFFGKPPTGREREFTTGLIHYCFNAHKTTYKSKSIIAKKIYNFRVNLLKKKAYNDNSTSVKLQAEIHYGTMKIIKEYADAHNISIGAAIDFLIENGLLSLNCNPGVVRIYPK